MNGANGEHPNMRGEVRQYRLVGVDGQIYLSDTPGALGGNSAARIYGRLDCPAALRALARGGYTRTRVFFLDEATAIKAGYRPCGACLRDQYLLWKGSSTPTAER